MKRAPFIGKALFSCSTQEVMVKLKAMQKCFHKSIEIPSRITQKEHRNFCVDAFNRGGETEPVCR